MKKRKKLFWLAGFVFALLLCLTACGECEHTYSDWIVKKEATTTSVGERVKICTKCSYAYTEKTPKLTHIHSYGTEWKYNSTEHWNVCSCGEKLSKYSHSFGNWEQTKAPTASAAGEQARVCKVCGYTETKAVEKLNHTHSYSSAWSSDGSYHWQACSCGDAKNKAAHTFGDWKVTKKATEKSSGTRTRTCSVCKYVETETIARLDHTHSYSSSWSSDSTYHWHACSCGDKGNKAAHSYGSWTVTKKATCTENGTRTRTCSVCGYKETETVYASGSHSFGAWTDTKKVTCTENGTQTRTCTVCGQKETRTVYSTGTHTVVTDKAVAATTTSEGLTEGSHCSVCGTVIQAQKTVPSLDITVKICYYTGEVWDTYKTNKSKGYKLDIKYTDVTTNRNATNYVVGFYYYAKFDGSEYTDEVPKDATFTKDTTIYIKQIRITYGMEYIIENGYAYLTDYTGTGNVIYVPPYLDGYPVVFSGHRGKGSNGEAKNEYYGAFHELDNVASNKRIKKVIIPGTIKTVNKSAFAGCKLLKTVIIENGVKTITDHAFAGCSGLTNLTIPNSVTTIGEGAFYGCSSLTSIVIPDSVTEIGSSAFANCSCLTNVVIPTSVTRIGWYAFQSCSNLKSIQYLGTKAQWKAIGKGECWAQFVSFVVHCTDGDIQCENGYIQ